MKLKKVCKNIIHNFYEVITILGELTGCHRMPERSFFIKGKQFPVCARCTGAFFGYLTGGVLYFIFPVNIILNISFCFIMFTDWYLQYKKILESNNIRRVITGFLCGFGLIQISFSGLKYIIMLLRIIHHNPQ